MDIPNHRSAYRTPKRMITCCFGVPTFLVIAAVLIYVLNNRPPQIAIPTHTVPAVNARDCFIRANLLSRSVAHQSPYSMPGTPAQNCTLANFKGCADDAGPVIAEL